MCSKIRVHQGRSWRPFTSRDIINAYHELLVRDRWYCNPVLHNSEHWMKMCSGTKLRIFKAEHYVYNM